MSLPYPTSTFALEFICVLLYFAVDATRISLGSNGNRSETIAPLLLMVGLSLPLLGFFAYFLTFQVYVYALNRALPACRHAIQPQQRRSNPACQASAP